MSDTKLRAALIRLAAANPHFRPTLLPLLKSASEGDADPKSHDQNKPEHWYGLPPRRPALGEPALAKAASEGDADPKSHDQNKPEHWYGLPPRKPALGEPALAKAAARVASRHLKQSS